MHCNQFLESPLTRRQMLMQCANGFGAVALTALLSDPAYSGVPSGSTDPLAPRPPHFRPRANNVIFLFMDGGPSQVDTFDPKPRLAKEHGQPIKMKVPPTQFNNVGTVMQSPWKFRQCGQRLVSERSALRGRFGRGPVDGVELLRAHQRQLFHPFRQWPAGPA